MPTEEGAEDEESARHTTLELACQRYARLVELASDIHLERVADRVAVQGHLRIRSACWRTWEEKRRRFTYHHLPYVLAGRFLCICEVGYLQPLWRANKAERQRASVRRRLARQTLIAYKELEVAFLTRLVERDQREWQE